MTGVQTRLPWGHFPVLQLSRLGNSPTPRTKKKKESNVKLNTGRKKNQHFRFWNKTKDSLTIVSITSLCLEEYSWSIIVWWTRHSTTVRPFSRHCLLVVFRKTRKTQNLIKIFLPDMAELTVDVFNSILACSTHLQLLCCL